MKGWKKRPKSLASIVAKITIRCVIRDELDEPVCKVDWAKEGEKQSLCKTK